MKVIGYCWANELSDNDLAEPSEAIRLIWHYLKRRRWSGPVHLENPGQSLIDFHMRTSGRDLASLLRPGDVLIAPDQSYFFGSASQGLTFLKAMHDRQIAVHCIDRGAIISQGRLFETFVSILEPLAKTEPQLLRERMRHRKQQIRQKGHYLGGNVPIGFTILADGSLKANGSRNAILKIALGLRVKGLSLRAIAEELHERGYPISHNSVAQLLRSIGYPWPDPMR